MQPEVIYLFIGKFFIRENGRIYQNLFAELKNYIIISTFELI